MTIRILKPGLQTTVQACPRRGIRHMGVPKSGAADPLSHALANRLVDNAPFAAALETTLTGVSFRFESDAFVAVTGADASVRLNGEEVAQHRTLRANAGDEFTLGAARTGSRNYVAIAGGVVGDEVLGSASTYLPAGFGGHEGRALQADDTIGTHPESASPKLIETPAEFRPGTAKSLAMRACFGADIELLNKDGRFDLFDTNFSIANRADRMGLQLDGAAFQVSSGGRLESAPVFPGTIQCPEDGRPFLLAVDSGTIGGYPRVAQVIRADKHLIGQLRPGDHLRLLWRDPETAREELLAKHDYWRAWLPEIGIVI